MTSYATPDGAELDRDGLLVTLGALETAAWFLEDRASCWCDDCQAAPDELCAPHYNDLTAATRYRSLSRALGMD